VRPPDHLLRGRSLVGRSDRPEVATTRRDPGRHLPIALRTSNTLKTNREGVVHNATGLRPCLENDPYRRLAARSRDPDSTRARRADSRELRCAARRARKRTPDSDGNGAYDPWSSKTPTGASAGLPAPATRRPRGADPAACPERQTVHRPFMEPCRPLCAALKGGRCAQLSGLGDTPAPRPHPRLLGRIREGRRFDVGVLDLER
jgi:hypothetical protein